MIVDKIESFLNGSTKPFIGLGNCGKRFVVKALLGSKTAKVLFNEFVAGSLANQIGLACPTSRLASLGASAIKQLKDESLPRSSDCVAIGLIDGLRPVPFPAFEAKDEFAWEDFPEVNRQHLSHFFDNPEGLSEFYGQALFELWVLLEDRKYETLFVRPDGSPLLGGTKARFREWVPHPTVLHCF